MRAAIVAAAVAGAVLPGPSATASEVACGIVATNDWTEIVTPSAARFTGVVYAHAPETCRVRVNGVTVVTVTVGGVTGPATRVDFDANAGPDIIEICDGAGCVEVYTVRIPAPAVVETVSEVSRPIGERVDLGQYLLCWPAAVP